MTSDDAVATNPLIPEWTGPHGLPPFAAIAAEHFKPAFDAALAAQRAEIDRIAADPGGADLRQHDRGAGARGRSSKRVGGVFFNLAGRPYERRLAGDRARDRAGPRRAPQRDLHERGAVLPHRRALREAASLGLTPSRRGCSSATTRSSSAPARGSGPRTKARLAAITERLASLGTQFCQNVLADEKAWALVLDGRPILPACRPSSRGRGRARRPERGHAGKHVVTLSRSIIEPFLHFLDPARPAREGLPAWTARGENGGATDNRDRRRDGALRAEKAQLLGYESFAHFKLDDTMAKTPEAVLDLLDRVWSRPREQAGARARRPAGACAGATATTSRSSPGTGATTRRSCAGAPRLRRGELKPYLQLDRIIEAAFDAAHRLFGLTFEEIAATSRAIIPDVRVCEVTDADGRAASACSSATISPGPRSAAAPG